MLPISIIANPQFPIYILDGDSISEVPKNNIPIENLDSTLCRLTCEIFVLCREMNSTSVERRLTFVFVCLFVAEGILAHPQDSSPIGGFA